MNLIEFGQIVSGDITHIDFEVYRLHSKWLFLGK